MKIRAIFLSALFFVSKGDAQSNLYSELSFGQSKFSYSGNWAEQVNQTQYLNSKMGSAFSFRIMWDHQPVNSRLSYGIGLGYLGKNGQVTVRTQSGNDIQTFTGQGDYHAVSIPIFVNYDFADKRLNTFFGGAGIAYNLDSDDRYNVLSNEVATEIQIGYKYKRLITKLVYSGSLNDLVKANYKQLKIHSLNLAVGFNLLKTKSQN